MATFPQTDVATNGVTMAVNLPGYVQGGVLQRFQVNPRGELRAAFGLLPSLEIVRQGSSYIQQSDAIAAQNHALPTTTADHTFTNLYPVGGKHLVLDTIGWLTEITDDVAAERQMIFQQQAAVATAATQGTADTRNLATNLLTQVNAVNPNVLSAHTGLITNVAWSAIGPNFVTTLTATVGFGIWIPLDGAIVVPPQRQVSFAVVATKTATISQGSMMYIWHEQQLQ